jgi:hypothetical protein
MNIGKEIKTMRVRAFYVLAALMLSTATVFGITRDDVVANAAPFRDLRWSSKNSLNSCKATTWIRTPHAANSTVIGMVYNWGGNNTIAQFTQAIAGTGYPGNNCALSQGNTLGLRPNTWGVDCSGFFGNIFGITQKLDTTTIRNMTVAVRGDHAGLRTGDILVKAGDHVAVYLSGSPTGAPLIIESSAYDWRVVQRTASWSEFKLYESRRYAQLQDAGIAKFETMSAPTIRKGAPLVANLTLRESDGNNITYDGLALRIFNDNLTVSFGDWIVPSQIAFRGDELRKFTLNAVVTNLLPGTYRIIVSGKVGTRWTPFVPNGTNANSTPFTITK